MVFSSLLFLFAFLPLVLGLYYLSPSRWRNVALLCASLAFYSWGEGFHVLILLLSITLNWLIGGRIEGASSPRTRRIVLSLGIAGNLTILAAWKYANFFVDSLNTITAMLGQAPLDLAPVHLPIGISFFTFQAISYLVDVHRGEAEHQHNPLDVALYISLFPQLIAGPIVRYRDVAEQIRRRPANTELFASGIRRFAIGLAKKVLIANAMGRVADDIFALQIDELSPSTAWAGALAYTLQIYFDFSAYSDMAIGLGRMFGFSFLENFNYPYISRSITEFWRRWHISLSSWFRDYLYIPLGGNRAGPARTYLNLVLVFFLCGLWHGASWSFVVWGLFHGAWLVVERMGLRQRLDRLPRIVASSYTLLLVVVGWVLFRSDTLGYALDYLGLMFGLLEPTAMSEAYPLALYMDHEVYLFFLLGVVGSAPWPRRYYLEGRDWLSERWRPSVPILDIFAVEAVLLLSASYLAGGTHNPFIYFRF